jgi:hypothetical protein
LQVALLRRGFGVARTHGFAWAVVLVGFAVLVSANSGGYRYGVSDQAFYVPVFADAANPALFPRGRMLLEPQSRLTVLDELVGDILRTTNIGVPALCAAGYVLTLVLFVVAAAGIGNRLFGSMWATVALIAALTLRHRIADTGVNTFEGYFHPRVLAFAIGLLAVACVLRRRWPGAVALIAAAMIVHPTTGGWFAVWLALGAILARQRDRAVPALLVLAAAAGIACVYVLADWRPGLVQRIDEHWLAALSSRDYLFPNTWSFSTWLTNAIAPAVLLAGYRLRARGGHVTPEERIVAFGCMALVVVFLITLPLVASGVAVAVQLQISRVLWMVEFLATVYLVWMLTNASSERRAMTLTAALVLLSAARGIYILNVQFDRPLAQVDLPRSDWQAMCEWALRHTPVDAGFLADPQHVNRYGVSFRIAAQRDVFVEAMKDPAMGIYSRAGALDVRDRVAAGHAFDQLTAADVRRLARRYGLTYLISARRYDLPLVHAVGPLRAYRVQ